MRNGAMKYIIIIVVVVVGLGPASQQAVYTVVSVLPVWWSRAEKMK